jgi:YHS domain-containing protein
VKSVLARSKQWLLFLLIALPATAVLAQQGAAEPRLILKGYDPVAYFTVGRPVQGAAQHQYDWDGARYYFSSAANRDKFAADPERYAPQFSGYCTGSLSRGVRAEAHPDAWIISDGRLYVFGQPKFREIALQDPDWLAVRIPKAAENWKK